MVVFVDIEVKPENRDILTACIRMDTVGTVNSFHRTPEFDAG